MLLHTPVRIFGRSAFKVRNRYDWIDFPVLRQVKLVCQRIDFLSHGEGTDALLLKFLANIWLGSQRVSAANVYVDRIPDIEFDILMMIVISSFHTLRGEFNSIGGAATS